MLPRLEVLQGHGYTRKDGDEAAVVSGCSSSKAYSFISGISSFFGAASGPPVGQAVFTASYSVWVSISDTALDKSWWYNPRELHRARHHSRFHEIALPLSVFPFS